MEDGTTLKDYFGEEFYEDVFAKKDSLRLDLNLATFERQCHEINSLLIEKCLFLRVCYLKKKFRYLIKRDLLQNKVRQDHSACVEKRFNGFKIIRSLREKELRKLFTPASVVYKPVSKAQQTINCYLSDSMSGVYHGVISKGKREVEYPTAEQCHDCSKFFTQETSFENHIKTWESMPGVV